MDPEGVPIPTPFIKNEILKTGAFVELFPKRRTSPIKPGDNLKKMGVQKWMSLYQFTFRTKKQMNNWEKASAQLLRRYKIAFELFYLNPDSTLNYQKMIGDLHRLIQDGLGCQSKDEIHDHFDLHRNRHRLFEKHPRLVQLRDAQRAMSQRRSDFYAVSPECYEKTIQRMVDDVRDECDGLDEEKVK